MSEGYRGGPQLDLTKPPETGAEWMAAEAAALRRVAMAARELAILPAASDEVKIVQAWEVLFAALNAAGPEWEIR